MMPEESAGSTATPSGSSPAPAPVAEAPAATPAAAPADTAGEEAPVDWLAESTSETDEAPESVAPSAAKPAAPAKPAEVPAAAKPAAATPAVAPAAIPAPASTPEAASVAQPAAVPAPAAAETPEAKTARVAAEAAEEEKLFNGLVEYYKIPDDQAAKLPTEPENVLPFMAAKLHQTIVKSVQQMLAQQLPQYIVQTNRVQESEKASRNAFYAKWPQLEKYEQQVLQAGAMFRQLNPNATTEQAIQAIGEIVSKSLNITVAAPGNGTGTVAAPLAATGFIPAGGGGGGRTGPTKTEENEFTRMSLEED